MTATDELRKMLDERGVDWRKWSGNSKRNTQWFMPNSNIGSNAPGGYCVTVNEHRDGTLYFKSMIASPEQAIAVTLGAGTCHMPVVRCKDCKLSRETEHDPKERWCHKSSLLAVKVSDDGFCAWGKRKVKDD